MKTCNLYVYVSSIHPWIWTNYLYRQYCIMPMVKYEYKNIEIRPLDYYSNDKRAKGISVFIIKGKAEDEKEFFDYSTLILRKFLNFLTLYCKHGFEEMDNYTYIDNEKKELFEKSILPPIGNIEHTDYIHNTTITDYITKAFEIADNFDTSDNLNKKIDNALFLYRSSFFQKTEEVRYILRFIALESLVDEGTSELEKDIIKEITEFARRVCKEKKIKSKSIEKICSHIGMLSGESIKNNIKNTIRKYQIKRYDKEIDVDKLWKARCNMMHKGIEVKNIHRLCIVLEDIIPMLVGKLINELT